MEEHIPKETILEFIKAYYSSLVQTPDKLNKYYSENASVYRPGMEQNLAVQIEQCGDKLVPEIQQGSRVEITNFSYTYLEDSVNLVVFVNILNSTETKALTQYFTLSFKNNSVWIEADSLTERDAKLTIAEQNANLVEFKLYKK